MFQLASMSAETTYSDGTSRMGYNDKKSPEELEALALACYRPMGSETSFWQPLTA